MLALKKRPAVKWKEREEEKRKGTAPYNERHLKGAEGDCDWSEQLMFVHCRDVEMWMEERNWKKVYKRWRSEGEVGAIVL